jgi:hypothetical protein
MEFVFIRKESFGYHACIVASATLSSGNASIGNGNDSVTPEGKTGATPLLVIERTVPAGTKKSRTGHAAES